MSRSSKNMKNIYVDIKKGITSGSGKGGDFFCGKVQKKIDNKNRKPVCNVIELCLQSS